MVFLHWDFTLQKNDQMSFTKNMKKNNKTCILICRTDSETKNWVNGSQVIVVSIEKKHATSPYTVKHQTYTSYSKYVEKKTPVKAMLFLSHQFL